MKWGRKRMASSGSSRRGLLTAGGILSIIGGTFEVTGGGRIALIVFAAVIDPLHPGVWSEPMIPTWLFIEVVGLIVLGVVAIVGGVSAVKRKFFALSLIGAICALPSVIFGLSLGGAIGAVTSMILGILAIAFVSVSKREFGARK
jgi:hypothetical protein